MRAQAVVEILPNAPSMTLDEWFALPEDEPGELVDGRLVEAEVPDWVHETILCWLVEHLRAWGSHDVRLAASGVKYALDERRGRMPDLSLFLGGRRPPRHGLIRSPPDIAVEVVSRGRNDVRRDRIEKVQDYAAFGVRWYWLVDPELRTFEVLELRDGAYSHTGAASTGRVSEIPGCDGLVLDLDSMWAEVDAL